MNIELLQKKEFFTIGEASEICDVPEYTIRYWEKHIGLISPIKKASHHRRYTKENLNTILQVKELIYKHKMTLEGAKKHINRFMGIGARPKNEQETFSKKNVKFLREIQATIAEIIKES